MFNDRDRATLAANYRAAGNYQVGVRYRVGRFESSKNRSWLKIRSHPGAVIMFRKKRTERNVLLGVYRCRRADETKAKEQTRNRRAFENLALPRIAAHKKAPLVAHIAMQYRAVLCRSALQLRLMKLSVRDVYRWGLPACGPFTTTAAGLVRRRALHLYFYLTNRFEFVEPRNAVCSTRTGPRSLSSTLSSSSTTFFSFSLLLSPLFVTVTTVK